MSQTRTIFKNTIFLAAAEVISKLLQFIIMLYAARLLPVEDFGKFSFALALSFIAVIFADLGINSLIIREIARRKDLANKYFFNSFLAKIILSLATFTFIIILINLLGYPKDSRIIVYIIWTFTIIKTFTELFYSIFRAFEKMGYDALLKIIRMIILSILALFVLFNNMGVSAFCYCFIITETIIALSALILTSRKFISLKSDFSLNFIKKLLNKSIPFGLAFIFGSIYFYIDSIMLSKIRGDVDVAVYSAAYNIAIALLFIPTVYTSAIYPVLSRYFRENASGLRLIYERSFKYLLIMGMPISAGLYALSGKIINFLYGSKYPGSEIVLEIISLFVFIKFINFLLGTLLSSADRQKKRMAGQGFTAAFNIILNLFLIPLYGFIGAAIATFITEIFLFIIYYLLVSKSLYFFNFTKILLKPLIGTAAMIIFIKLTGFHLLITIAASAVIYFIILYLIKTIDKKDYELIRNITR